MFIEIFGKYQTYVKYKLCIVGHSLSCFLRYFGGSELASKTISSVGCDRSGMIFHYKWNSICIS